MLPWVEVIISICLKRFTIFILDSSHPFFAFYKMKDNKKHYLNNAIPQNTKIRFISFPIKP